jgi:hypothetical protein
MNSKIILFGKNERKTIRENELKITFFFTLTRENEPKVHFFSGKMSSRRAQDHMMMMTFICSGRNNNQPTAIYPSGRFPRGLKKAHVMMLPSCPFCYYDGPIPLCLTWWCAKHFTVQPPSVPIYTNDRH